MNRNSIVEFKTNKVKGLFVSVPFNSIVEDCHFKDKESMPFALMVCHGSKNSIPSFFPIVLPKREYKLLGFSSSIDEKTVEENLGISFKEYIKILNDNDITVCYSDWSNYWFVLIF